MKKQTNFYDRACDHLKDMATLPDGPLKHWPVPNDLKASAEKVAASLRKNFYKSWD